MEQVVTALYSIFTIPGYLPALAIGLILGISVGAMPGLTAPMGIAVLLPLTYGMAPQSGLGMLVGLYCGAIFGGSIPAILINIPGTPSAVMTCLDGNALAKKGQGGKALGVAAIASFAGGCFSTICLMFAAPFLAGLAMRFGPHEYFATGLFGLSITAGISGKSMIKGFWAAAFGIFITVVGLDPITSDRRLTWDIVDLLSGIPFIPVMIGLFGFKQVLSQIESHCREQEVQSQDFKNLIPSWREMRKLAPCIAKSSVIGTMVGALPGAGGAIASFLAYDMAKRTSSVKTIPEEVEFGQGRLEGIAAPEAANNAVTGGALIPLLTLGIPGDAAVAIMLGALMMHNLSPGPLFFQNNADILYSIYVSMFLANIMFLILGLSGLRLFVKLLRIPMRVLLPIIVALCVVGSYSIQNNVFHIQLMLLFGVIGYLLDKAGIPSLPLVLGLVLGPMIEQNLRQALLIENGNLLRLFARPISGGIIALTLLLLGWSLISARRNKRKNNSA